MQHLFNAIIGRDPLSDWWTVTNAHRAVIGRLASERLARLVAETLASGERGACFRVLDPQRRYVFSTQAATLQPH